MRRIASLILGLAACGRFRFAATGDGGAPGGDGSASRDGGPDPATVNVAFVTPPTETPEVAAAEVKTLPFRHAG